MLSGKYSVHNQYAMASNPGYAEPQGIPSHIHLGYTSPKIQYLVIHSMDYNQTRLCKSFIWIMENCWNVLVGMWPIVNSNAKRWVHLWDSYVSYQSFIRVTILTKPRYNESQYVNREHCSFLHTKNLCSYWCLQSSVSTLCILLCIHIIGVVSNSRRWTSILKFSGTEVRNYNFWVFYFFAFSAPML